MIKKYCKNKLEINIENCLMKKKIKKREYGRIRYELMSEEEKERLERTVSKKIHFINASI